MPAIPDSGPLSDAELDALDDALSSLPDGRDPFDLAMLDGFLTGVLLCPRAVMPSDWLPIVFDARDDDALLPGDLARVEHVLGLVMRHHNTLAAHIAAREPFEPIVVDIQRDDGGELAGAQRFAGLWPWATGFSRAIAEYPLADDDSPEVDDVDAALLHIVRHLPEDPDDPSEAAREIAREQRAIDDALPLDDLDHAIDELMASVMDIADITRPRRPIARTQPKTGRNDPCPCGSGRKYKQCHGREKT
ncbi:MAG: UPF0149 family protein [Betaproteobacteria bacterium]